MGWKTERKAMKNKTATIDVSAQFGGRDAADAAMSHFKALKLAAKDIAVDSFPFPQLAFILRVDGNVNQYGFSGTGNPEIDRGEKYLSIDIGITKGDREDIPSRICSAILESPEIVAAAIRHKGIDGFQANDLTATLKILCERYIKEAS
jgi:hypothetical protein